MCRPLKRTSAFGQKWACRDELNGARLPAVLRNLAGLEEHFPTWNNDLPINVLSAQGHSQSCPIVLQWLSPLDRITSHPGRRLCSQCSFQAEASAVPRKARRVVPTAALYDG